MWINGVDGSCLNPRCGYEGDSLPLCCVCVSYLALDVLKDAVREAVEALQRVDGLVETLHGAEVVVDHWNERRKRMAKMRKGKKNVLNDESVTGENRIHA